MDKLTVFIVLIILQSASPTWGASYLLHLQNGNVLRTSHYWEEGDEIKFYVYGGVAGIQRKFVTGVTITTLNYKEDAGYKGDIVESRIPRPLRGEKSKESPRDQAGNNESNPDGSVEKGEVVDLNHYRQRKAALREKLEDALQRNREAIAKKDQAAKEQTRKEYLEFSRRIIDLGDELKRKNKGLLPDWWEE